MAAPRSLRAASVGPAGVTLKWSAPKGVKPAHYVVLRDGKSLGRTTRMSYTDSKIKPGRTYRYAVQPRGGRPQPVGARRRAGVRAAQATPTTLSLELTAGSYTLYRSLTGQEEAGMRTDISVR